MIFIKRTMLTLKRGRWPYAGIAAITMLCAAAPVLADEGFKHLSGAELKKAIVGKTITDGTHWSDKFKPDGTVESIMHGQVLGGRWRVRGGELCIGDSNGKGKRQAEDCFEVWRHGHAIEYRRNGNAFAQGDLVNR
jgi:hypothetical protein